MGSVRALAATLRSALRWFVSALLWVVSLPGEGCWWLGFLRVELWRVDGEEQHGRLPLSILCAVSDNIQNKNYLLELIFGDSYRQRCLGRYWLWNLAKACQAEASDCSIIIGECCESHLRLTGRGNWFLIPIWVLGGVDLPREAGATRKVKGDIQKIRHHALQFEITRDLRQFDDFYYNMYRPHITQRFGHCAEVTSYERMKAIFCNCDLLLVKNREESIAGQLILYGEEGPYLWEMGIRDGNKDHIKRGAGGSAVFHFGLQYLQDKGHRNVMLGWSRPFLRDGVLRFKKNWSQRITSGYSNGFALRVLSYTPAVKAFLCNNPFVFKRQGRFYGAVFVDTGTPLSADDIRQIDKDYFHVGLSCLHVYWLQKDHEPAPGLVPAELAERVELRRAGDPPEESDSRAHQTSP